MTGASWWMGELYGAEERDCACAGGWCYAETGGHFDMEQ